VWSSGADHGVFEGVTCPAYVKDLPLDRLADDVLIAYEMNGRPLTLEHGFPARLVVPGYYGTNSVKWLTRMTLATTRAESPFTTRWYNDVVHDDAGILTGTTVPVWAIAPESIIVSPAPESRVTVGEVVEVWGWAWADGGVASVEFCGDGRTDWMPTAVEPPHGRAWQRFAAAWCPTRRGAHELCARAHSREGGVQPPSGARNAFHRVPVAVV
jgi:DMSO/TMAO reductase YedYZ molybdopterin-dependent catalytic subunit